MSSDPEKASTPIKSFSVEKLVDDWGGFEDLIARLHETGEVKVERNVILQRRSGAPRQIDVLLRHKQGLYEHLVIVECKYRNRNVERADVDELVATVREVGASRGVIFSSKGFQSGAITQAKHDAIDLFTVREPTDAEWGAPGRHVSLYLHVISLAPGLISIDEAYTLPYCIPRSNNIEMVIGDAGPKPATHTAIETESGKDKTLEDMITRCVRDAAKQAYSPKLASFNGSLHCQILARINVNVVPTKDIKVFANGGCVFIRKMSFQLGLRIAQSHISVDRGSNYLFALAVENCINRQVFAASRRHGESRTELIELSKPVDTSQVGSDILRNNSIMSVWLGAMFAFDDFLPMKPGETKFIPPEPTNTVSQQPAA